MILALDTSAAMAVALGLPQASGIAAALRTAKRVIAPDLLVPEATNAAWKLTVFGQEKPEACAQALQRALRLADEFCPSAGLADEVLAETRRTRHPAYDLFYLVLARRHAATLASLDRKLLALARRMKLPVLGP
jgi:predicted nucleic acid-binding protein